MTEIAVLSRIEDLVRRGEIYRGQHSDELEKVLVREFKDVIDLPRYLDEIVGKANYRLYGEFVTIEAIHRVGESFFKRASDLRKKHGYYDLEIKQLMLYLRGCEEAGIDPLKSRIFKFHRKTAWQYLSDFEYLVDHRCVNFARAAHVINQAPSLRRYVNDIGLELDTSHYLNILERICKANISLSEGKKIAICLMLGMPWEDALLCSKKLGTLKEAVNWAKQIKLLKNN